MHIDSFRRFIVICCFYGFFRPEKVSMWQILSFSKDFFDQKYMHFLGTYQLSLCNAMVFLIMTLPKLPKNRFLVSHLILEIKSQLSKNVELLSPLYCV